VRRVDEPVSRRRIMADMIAACARNNGHADLPRERVDGATGTSYSPGIRRGAKPLRDRGRAAYPGLVLELARIGARRGYAPSPDGRVPGGVHGVIAPVVISLAWRIAALWWVDRRA
jgi:Protein of unknown function (DUF664)